MDLTTERMAEIDRMSYADLLRRWRFAPSGDPWLQGETGKYWEARMRALKEADPEMAVAASKAVGW